MRELLSIAPGARPLELAKMCYPEVSAEETRKSAEFLVQAGLLKKRDGIYEQTEKVVTSSAEIIPLAIRSMHKQMAKFAYEAIDRVSPTERNFAGVTLAVSKNSYDRIVDEMMAFQKRIIAIACDEKNADQVYRINLQLFPMTKSKEENNE